jgi:hypothetical protein
MRRRRKRRRRGGEEEDDILFESKIEWHLFYEGGSSSFINTVYS